MTAETIRAAVVARMESLGLTSYAVARDSGGVVSQDQVRRYVLGDSDLTSEKLDAVFRVLGIKLRKPLRHNAM